MADISNDVFFAGVAELSAGLRAKTYSCHELVTAFAERLEKLGPRYNALALSFREAALKRAREIDAEFKRGRFRGALHGVPYAVKDLLAAAGGPTTWGAKPYAAQMFQEDATAVKKLAKAGAVLIGKLSMVELAGGGGYRFPNASLFGPGLNPWDPARWSGGSSSGSGSAVAAGLVPFALGSETNGSLLTPCAFCGVTGLRPTYGLVSRTGAMALAWTMDKIGPMARNAEDCGIILQSIAGGDAADPGSAGRPFYFAPQYVRPLKELTAGWAASDFEQSLDPAMQPAMNAALTAIRETGLRFEPSQLPDFPFSSISTTVIGAEGSAAFADLIESGKVAELADSRQIAGLKAGLEIPARDYLHAMRLRRVLQEQFREIFSRFDVLIAPTRFQIAPKVTDPLDRLSGNPPGAGQGFRNLLTAGNLAGLPALTLPCGFADGMPVAICVVGKPFSENTLLSIGIAFQRLTDWHRRRQSR